MIKNFQDLASFLTSITIPDFVPVTRHQFAPPPPKEVTKVSEIVVVGVAIIGRENLHEEWMLYL